MVQYCARCVTEWQHCSVKSCHIVSVPVDVEFAVKMTMTACILHNICIRDPDADNDLMMKGDHSEADAKEDASPDVSYYVAPRKSDATADRL